MQPRNMFRRITALALAFTMLLSAGLAAVMICLILLQPSRRITSICAAALFLLRCAGTDYKGDSITVLGTSGNYYKVSYNDRTGYVLKQYVDVSAATTPLPTVAVVETATGYPYETTTKDSVNLRKKKSTSSG